MIFKPYYRYETGCAAYVFGCGTLGKCAVVDAQEPVREAERFAERRLLRLGPADGARSRDSGR